MCSTRFAPYAHGIAEYACGAPWAHGIAEYACGAPWAHGIGALHSLRSFRAPIAAHFSRRNALHSLRLFRAPTGTRFAPWAHGIGAIHSLRLFRALMGERCALNPPSGRSGYPPSEASRAAGAMRGASGAKGGCSATAFPPTPTR